MKKIFAIIAALAAFFSVYADAPSDTIFEADPYFILMGEADSAIADNRWEDAVARLNDALAVKPEHPSNVILLSNLGAVYSYLGQDSLAIAAYDRALETAPSMTTVLLGKGRLLLKRGRDYDAFEIFSRVIEVDSLSTDARFYRGMMALYGGNKDMAESDFNVLKAVTPKSSDTAIALGTLYSLTGREREAIPYLQQLIDDDPQAEFYASLAGCYLEIEELSKAGEILAEGMKYFPNDPELYYYRAWLNRDRYNNSQARLDARRAIQLGASETKVKALFGE